MLPQVPFILRASNRRWFTQEKGDNSLQVIGLIDLLESQPRLILTSGSPRRRDLLKAAGLTFEIVSPNVEELTGERLKPRGLSLMNARLKACAVGRIFPEDLGIGSDTVVALGGCFLESRWRESHLEL